MKKTLAPSARTTSRCLLGGTLLALAALPLAAGAEGPTTSQTGLASAVPAPAPTARAAVRVADGPHAQSGDVASATVRPSARPRPSEPSLDTVPNASSGNPQAAADVAMAGAGLDNGATYLGGGFFGTFPSALGWYFTPSEDLLVQQLGFFDEGADGLGESHDIGLFVADGTPVATTTIAAGTGSELRGSTRFVDISPVTLTAGVQYYLTANDYVTDRYVFGDTAVGFDPRLSFDGFSQGGSNDINSAHSNFGGLPGNLGPNIGIGELPPAVKDSAVTYLGGGTIANFASAVGWFFVPNEDVQISELGYLDIGQDGLAEAHDVGIFLADGSVVTTATVPAGTAAPLRGSSRFVSIPPVTLSAGIEYYMTANNNLADPYVFGDDALAFDPRVTWTGNGGGASNDIFSEHTNFGGLLGNVGPNMSIFSCADLGATYLGGGSPVTVAIATGWHFTAEESETVFELGFLDDGQDGLDGSHNVGLFRTDGTPVASANIPAGTAAPLRGSSRFVPIDPVTLVAGETYYITADNNALDGFIFGTGLFEFSSNLTWNGFADGASDDINSPHSLFSGLPGNVGPNLNFCDAGSAPCPADLDGNGSVGFDDLLAVLSAFGGTDGGDTDGDGDTDFDDLLAVLSAWGPCP